MVMDSDEKFPECDSLPAIPVMPMAQERASQPEAGIIIQGASSVLGPLLGSLSVHVPLTLTPHSVPAIEGLVPQASSKPLADTMSVDKEPAGEEIAGLLGVAKDRGHVVSDVHLKSLTS